MNVISWSASVPSSNEYVRLTKHIKGIPSFRVQGDTENGCTFEAFVSFEPSANSYEVQHLSINRGSERSPINGSSLRDIRIAEMIQHVLWGTANAQGGGWLITSDGQFAGDERNNIQQGRDAGMKFRPDERILELVANIYELGVITGKKPTKLVANDFGIPDRTASHWVKLARERGHLEI